MVTTTNDPAGGGHPRLILSAESSARLDAGDDVADARGQHEVELRPGVSSPDADLRLAGLEGRHAEVRRDAADEYRFVRLGAPGSSTVDGVPADERSLHTGDRLQLGNWSMSFSREEFADHGRPYGGRQGGEGTRQRPQQAPRKRGTSASGGSDRAGTDPGEYF